MECSQEKECFLEKSWSLVVIAWTFLTFLHFLAGEVGYVRFKSPPVWIGLFTQCSRREVEKCESTNRLSFNLQHDSQQFIKPVI